MKMIVSTLMLTVIGVAFTEHMDPIKYPRYHRTIVWGLLGLGISYLIFG